STVPHGIRETLFFLFLIFLLRALLRKDWLAGAVFALIFSSLNLASATSHAVLITVVNFLLMSGFAYVALRWGLVALAVAIAVSALVGEAPVTANTSAWYFGSGVFMLGIVLALALWAFRTAIGGQRLWKEDLLG